MGRQCVSAHDRITAPNISVLIIVAGMEGALPSVVGGLVRVPVIDVPTSVGYAASGINLMRDVSQMSDFSGKSDIFRKCITVPLPPAGGTTRTARRKPQTGRTGFPRRSDIAG